MPNQTSTTSHPIRVLQIVENLNTGAVENWLVRMFKASRRDYPNYQWTFFCVLGQPGRLDEEVRAFGGEIIYSPYNLSQNRAFFRALRQVMKEGHYDVMHCHHDIMSAVYLWASLGIPIHRRIVQVHNADLGLPTPNPIKAILLWKLMQRTCLRADRIVGISRHTLSTFTGKSKPKQGRDVVLYYGVDTSKFPRQVENKPHLRQRLNLPVNKKIILFAGRMDWFKNPLFVVEILRHLASRDPDVIAVFAGKGPLENEVRQLAKQHSLEDKVMVLGWFEDTATLMRACDVFVFPRVETRAQGIGKEGLGLVVMEAQAAALPILMSRGVPEDVLVVSELVEIVPLVSGAQVWAEAVLRILSKPRLSPETALQKIETSPFSMSAGVANLMALYKCSQRENF